VRSTTPRCSAIVASLAPRLAVLRIMASRGASDAKIAEHLGVVDRTVLRWRSQLQIPAGRPRPFTDTARWVDAEARDATSRPQRQQLAARSQVRGRDRIVGPVR
jgi:transposase-like protein